MDGKMDGYVKIGVQLDDLQFEKEIKEVDKYLDKKKKLEVEVGELGQFQSKIAQYEMEMDDLELESSRLAKERAEMDRLWKKSLGFSASGSPDYDKMSEEMYKIDKQIGRILDKQRLEEQKLEEKNQELLRTNEYLGIAEAKLEQAREKADKIKFEKLSKVIKGTDEGLKKVSAGIGGIIKKVAKWGMAVFGIRSAYMAVRRAMSVLSQYNQQLATDLQYITFGLAKVLEPVVQRMVSLMYTALAYINYIAQAWFGVNLFARSSVSEFQKGNKAIDGMAGSAKKLNKELNKMPFDEMNTLSKEQDNSGGGRWSVTTIYTIV